MAIRFFYAIIGIFSVFIAFLMVQTPYISEDMIENLSISSTQGYGVVSYELNATKIFAKHSATQATRYRDKDEFLDYFGIYLDDSLEHNLSARFVEFKDKIAKFQDNAEYKNSDNIIYRSKEIVYDINLKTISSKEPFVIFREFDKIEGNSAVYYIKDKIIDAKGVKAWLER